MKTFILIFLFPLTSWSVNPHYNVSCTKSDPLKEVYYCKQTLSNTTLTSCFVINNTSQHRYQISIKCSDPSHVNFTKMDTWSSR